MRLAGLRGIFPQCQSPSSEICRLNAIADRIVSSSSGSSHLLAADSDLFIVGTKCGSAAMAGNVHRRLTTWRIRRPISSFPMRDTFGQGISQPFLSITIRSVKSPVRLTGSIPA